MQQFHRLEDAYPFWRAQARLLAKAEPGPGGEAARLPFQRIATACLDWLSAEECWPNRAADMPAVTGVMMEELDARIADGFGHELPVPFYSMPRGRFRRELL